MELMNLDFENGPEPWADDPGYQGSRLEWGVDTSVAKSGRASLRIVAANRKGRVEVRQSTEQFTRGARYEYSYWMKVSRPEMAENCHVWVTFRKPKADGSGLNTEMIYPASFLQRTEDGWMLRRDAFTVGRDVASVQIGLRVQDTVGTVWFDDIRIRQVSGKVQPGSMYVYAPHQVEVGPEMVQRFNRLVEARSSFLARAKTFNQRLVDVARLTEDARRLERCAGYLNALGVSSDIAADLSAAQGVERELDALFQTYGRLFADRDEAGLPEFDRAAAALPGRIDAAQRRIAGRVRALQEAAREKGVTWTAPVYAEPRPVSISPDGRPNQIVFGTVSLQTHFEMEDPLTVNRVYSTPYLEVQSAGPGDYDFSAITQGWEYIHKLGAEHSAIGTALAVHNSMQVAPAWFLEKYKDDPDILLRGADGTKGVQLYWSIGAPLNTWRPEVREMTADFITRLGRTFRDQPQFLWYVIAPENGGPYFISENNVKSIGYNASALPDFHAYLKGRYLDIADLNRQWKTDYARFEDIAPPDDILIVKEWKRPHPLAYEFQTWRRDRHHAWLKFLYDTLKQADPNKPALADHSSLLSQVDGSRIFDTADIVCYHHDHQYKSMLGAIYLYSLNRFAGKQMGLYENMWSCQENTPRTADERVQRAALSKYLYRTTTWGCHLQVWWYAYTQNDYILRYNGNWFDPVYDLTTLRYSAAALPVGKAKVKRLEDVFLNAKIVPARLAMIQPNTSELFQGYWGEPYMEMMELHPLLFERNDLYELIPETYFTDGRASLDQFDAVILPCAPFFPDGLAERLRAWVRKGGLLIATGPFGLYDRFGFDRPDLWTEVFGQRLPARRTGAGEREWAWEVEGEGDLLDAPLGKGRVIVTLRSLRDPAFRDRIAPRILETLEAKAPRAARCPSNDFEMTVQETPEGKRHLCVLNRRTDRAVMDRVTLAGRFRGGVDLDVPGGFPVPFEAEGGETSFALSLEPGEFTLIALQE